MTGKTHSFVAALALACLPEKERDILTYRWRGIDSGATLSDDFRIFWEPDAPGDKKSSLVHRCFVDSKSPKDHGCIVRCLDHAEGSISFAEAYMNGDLDGYDEVDFLENLGMFLGVLCHHIGDMCTPCHVGHAIKPKDIGFSSQKYLHSRIERDMESHSNSAKLHLQPPEEVTFSKEFFWSIAKYTYEIHYTKLPSVYSENANSAISEMVSDLLGKAIVTTRDAWHTVFVKTKMLEREWTIQPLI